MSAINSLRILKADRIKWRLATAYIAVIFLSMTIIGLYLSYSLERQSRAELRTILESHALLVKDVLEEEYATGSLIAYGDTVCNNLSQRINSRIVALDQAGKVIGDSARVSPVGDNPLAQQEKSLKSAPCILCHSEARHHESITLSQPLLHHGRVVGEFRISNSLFGIKHASARTRRFIFFTLVIAAVLAAAVSHRLAAGIAQPITRLNAMARKMASGNLDQRVDVETADEIGELARSFNAMAEHLRETIAELAEQRDKMGTILVTMADGIIVTDEAGKIVLFNNASERIFGRKAEEAFSCTPEELQIHPQLSQMMHETLSTGRLLRKEVMLPGTPEKCLNAYSTPVKDDQAQIRGAVLVLQDLSEMRQQEQLQKEFVANVSHELRTPITAVRVTAEALLAGAKDDPKLLDRFLSTLVKESERLSLLIDDLLEIATREAGRIHAHKNQVSVKEVVDRILIVCGPEAARNDIEVIVDVPEDTTAYADERQLEQVIGNLVDNAIKYTPEGGSVHISGSEDEASTIVAVSDTGIGIPKGDVTRIFERFYRVDKARSRQLGGTGLGLAIVKDIVEGHRGNIAVQSQLGKGSTFTIVLPKWKPTSTDAREPGQPGVA